MAKKISGFQVEAKKLLVSWILILYIVLFVSTLTAKKIGPDIYDSNEEDFSLGKSDSIAIVGISSIFPGASNTRELWQTILHGRDMITDVPDHYWLTRDYYDPDPRKKGKTYAKRGGFIPKQTFDPDVFRLPPKTLTSIDTVQMLALICARRLIENCTSIQSKKVDKKNISVILGSGAATEMMVALMGHLHYPNWRKAMRECQVPESLIERIFEKVSKTYPDWTENSFPGSLGNITAGRISNRLDLGGTNCVVDAACASSLAAVSTAIQELQLKKSDLVITGGADAHNDIFMFMCFSKTPALSPSGDCRPFSKDADGTILGEGIGLLALKRLEDAERDKDTIYAVIRGVGASSDGLGKSIYAPLIKGQALAIQRAYKNAGCSPLATELVEAHGTATRANDSTEFNALCQEFTRDRASGPWCGLGSIKSQIGHTKAAAGAAALIKMAMALHHKVLPPTIKVEQPNPEMDMENSPFYLNTRARPWIHSKDSKRQGSLSAFGFGGSNFHLVVQEYAPKSKQKPASNPRYFSFLSQLILIAGDTIEQLRNRISQIQIQLGDQEIFSSTALKSQTGFDAQKKFRLALIAEDPNTALGLLDKAESKLDTNPDKEFSISNRLHYGCKPRQGKLAFLFPGQGSQYTDMGADLAMAFSQARDVWDRIASSPDLETACLPSKVFPVPTFDKSRQKDFKKTLDDTDVAQPAIGGVSLSMLALLDRAGVRADCTAGHSYGELTALFCGKTISSARDLIRISRIRGSLMAGSANPDIPSGMTAVMASKKEILHILDKQASRLVIANENSPEQYVLSGSLADLDTIETALIKNRIQFQRLPVSMAFHSEFVAPLAGQFLEELEPFDFKPPQIPVYSNAGDGVYPDEPANIKKNLANQLARPVRFRSQIETMYKDGVRIFVEVGPGNALTGLVNRCLDGRPYQAAAMGPKDKNGIQGFWNLLGFLSARGVPISFERLWEGIEVPNAKVLDPPSSFSVQIDGSNFNKPYPPKGGADSLPDPVPEHMSELEKDRPASLTARFPRNFDGDQNADYKDLKTLHENLKTAHENFIKASDAFMEKMSGQEEKGALFETEITKAAPVRTVPPAGDEEIYQKAILEILADKTGYPEDIFDPDTELEAGFGIDSITKVEVLGEFQDRFPDLELGDIQELYVLSTLNEIMDHVKKTAKSNPCQANDSVPKRASVERRVLEIGPAPESAGPGPGPFFKNTLYIIQDSLGVAPLISGRLGSAGIKTSMVEQCPRDAENVLFLKGINPFSDESQAIEINREAFLAANACAPVMEEKGGIFILVQDTGGDFNLSGRAGVRSWSGGLAALAKTASWEWPKARVKAIDIKCSSRTPEGIAIAIEKELLKGGAELEAGLDGNTEPRNLSTRRVQTPGDNSPLPPGLVILATGGGKGITRDCITALSEQVAMKFAILGRSDFGSDGISGLDIQETIATLQANGSQAIYLSADVRSQKELAQALDDVRSQWGSIDILIHGAGIIADRSIAEKGMDEFNEVFDTKVKGLQNLLAETAGDPLRRICCFSSIVARQGNFRQSDYAMANEILNKVCQSEAKKRRGACIVRSINWGPWDGGMVEDHHKTVFQAMGISLIPKEEGKEFFIREISCGDEMGPVEVIISAESSRSGTNGSGTHGPGIGRAEAGREKNPSDSDKNQFFREEEWSLTLADHPWIKDHCPTFCIPVLPMMGVLDMLCTAGLARFPNKKIARVIHLESKQWAAFNDGILQGKTRIREKSDQVLKFELYTRETQSSPPKFSLAAVAGIQLDDTYPEPGNEKVPPLEKGRSIETPYESGQLFHGPSLQLMEDLVVGDNGADCRVKCESRGVPYGMVHPGVLDAALHCMPSHNLNSWFPGIGTENIAFPLKLSDFSFYKKLPDRGRVVICARADRLDKRYFPVVRFWIFHNKRVAQSFTLTLLLMPKGPLASIPAGSWKRFLSQKGYTSGIELAQGKKTDRKTAVAALKAMDWLPGTLAKVYNINDTGDMLFQQAALKDHAASLIKLHPANICLDPGTGRCANLPLNRFFITSETGDKRIRTRCSGPESIDITEVADYWHSTVGIKPGILSDLLQGITLKFIRRLILEAPGQIQSHREKSMVFMSNHQTGVETPILVILLCYLFNSPIYGITNKEQQTGMLGSLNHLIQSFSDTRLPFKMVVFDQEKKNLLTSILNEITLGVKKKNASMYVACEGRRAFRAGHRVSRVSSKFTDFAIDENISVVPIRFTGGLPKQGPDQYYDYPYGYGQQDIHIGRIIRWETLAGLDYANRPRLIMEKINNLGPEPEKEIPLGPDTGFQKKVEAMMKHGNLSKLAAIALACLGDIKSPCPETIKVVETIKKNHGPIDLEPGSVLHGVISFLSGK